MNTNQPEVSAFAGAAVFESEEPAKGLATQPETAQQAEPQFGELLRNVNQALAEQHVQIERLIKLEEECRVGKTEGQIKDMLGEELTLALIDTNYVQNSKELRDVRIAVGEHISRESSNELIVDFVRTQLAPRLKSHYPA